MEVSLEFNPYSAPHMALKDAFQKADVERLQWVQKLAWYDGFDHSTANRLLSAAKREADAIGNQIEVISRAIAVQATRVESLKAGATLGLDPRNWFSSERTAKKRDLAEARQALEKLEEKRQSLQQRSVSVRGEADKLSVDLNRFRSMNRLEMDAAIQGLLAHAQHLKVECEKLEQQKTAVDAQLKEPLAELEQFDREMDTLRVQITRAQRLENKLSNAANSYERRMIHDECRQMFQEDKPGRVLQAKERALQSVYRNREKLVSRLQSIAKRASREVKLLVIDGNNLCYAHDKLIGLPALQAVTRQLADKFDVLVVFDASIRSVLRMRDREIAACLDPRVKVHVVASQQRADETLLDAGASPTSYIISNDRFKDFPDKDVVRAGRLLRHEIVNGQVFIHDLGVVASYSLASA
jgi:hypothetical protein